MYSQLIKELGVSFKPLKLKEPIFQIGSYHINNTLKDKLYSAFAKIQTVINTIFYKNSLTIVAPYFSYDTKKKLFRFLVRGKFRYIFDDMRYEIKLPAKSDIILRDSLNLMFASDEFEGILSKLIFKNIPILFLENFKEFRKKVLNLPIKKSKIFFTANAFHSNYIFKFLVAEHYNGVKILNAQHGGGYGIDKVNVLEEYEKSVSDIFYTWGWGDNVKTKFLSHPKLYKRNAVSRNKNVLFAMDMHPRYVPRFYFQPISTLMVGYINFSIDFLKLVESNINLLIRMHPGDIHYRWFIENRIIDTGINFKFTNYNEKFNKQLSVCHIYVTGHLGTTYLESLAINKPTIIFINQDLINFRSSVRQYFDMLRKVKILHFSPASAASHLNSIYNSVNEWWMDKDTQAAREEFVCHFARKSENWIQEWAQEFDGALEK